MALKEKAFESIVLEEEIMLIASILSFSHNVFLPLNNHTCIAVFLLHLFQSLQMLWIWTSPKFCLVTEVIAFYHNHTLDGGYEQDNAHPGPVLLA